LNKLNRSVVDWRETPLLFPGTEFVKCSSLSNSYNLIKCWKIWIGLAPSSQTEQLEYLWGANDFFHDWDETVQNLAKMKRLSSKKSLKLYRKILFKVLTKVGINFVHFVWEEWAKWSQGVLILCSKRPFFLPMIQIEKIFYEILKKFLAKFSKIFQSFTSFYSILWN
jgi:hypothetical protein